MQIKMKRFLHLLVLLFMAGSAFGQKLEPDSSASARHVSDAEINKITSQLIAPCCWSETVNIHRSPAAENVRKAVVHGLSKGMAAEEIKTALVAEYGERILATPKLVGFNYFIFILPIFGLLFGGYLVWEFLIKSRMIAQEHSQKSSKKTSEYDAKIESELDKFES